MLDIMSIKNKTMLLSNLSFDHPLSLYEINDLIEILSSGVSIGQVYFKDKIDMDSIEKVKLLLEGLPNIDDSRIEKYIMKEIDDNDKEKLDTMAFQNIGTWNIAYSIEHNRFSVTTLSKYRLIDKWFRSTIHEIPDDLSKLEKICYLYDKVKLFEFDSSSRYGRLPEIIADGCCNSYGYSLLLNELLKMCKIPSKIEKYSIDQEESFVTLTGIKDSTYDIDGIYLFDASMDTISKEQYKYGLARRMNYNFFAITTDKFSRLNGQVVPEGILKVLMSKESLEYRHNLSNFNKKNGIKEVTDLEECFENNIDEVYLKCFNSKEISKETLFNVFSGRVNDFSKNMEERELLKTTLIDNYWDREEDLFVNKNSKQMLKDEII